MMPGIPQLVLDLVSGVAALGPVLVAIEAESAPDLAPLTMALGDVGSELVKRIAEVGESNAAQVFRRVEAVLSHGTEEEKNAVATGFLEGVVSAIDQLPERMRPRIAWHLSIAPRCALHAKPGFVLGGPETGVLARTYVELPSPRFRCVCARLFERTARELLDLRLLGR
jgi:hypothetical protein